MDEALARVRGLAVTVTHLEALLGATNAARELLRPVFVDARGSEVCNIG